MTPTASVPIKPEQRSTTTGPELLQLMDDLPQSKQVELLNCARSLRQQAAGACDQRAEPVSLRAVPADSLTHLTGLVALGGDAVSDTEALYDGT